MTSNPLASFLARTTASPYAVSLTLGLGSASYFFWGNLAGQSTGAVAVATNPDEYRKSGLDTSTAVEVWNWTYGRAAAYFGGSIAGAGLPVLAAAFLIPKAIYTPGLRNYLCIVSGTLLSVGVYTAVVLLPVNNRLVAISERIKRERSGEALLVSPLTKTQEDEAEGLLKTWMRLHWWRVALGGVGWLGTIAAYVTTV